MPEFFVPFAVQTIIVSGPLSGRQAKSAELQALYSRAIIWSRACGRIFVRSSSALTLPSGSRNWHPIGSNWRRRPFCRTRVTPMARRG